MRAALVVLLLAVLAGCGGSPAPAPPSTPSPAPVTISPGVSLTPTPRPRPRARARLAPLHGLVIALDPGHQLGNHNFPAQAGHPVDAGGFTKPCNSTGTATTDGWPEATFTWLLSHEVAARLERLGARVQLTRRTNSEADWGPCVDVRGRFAASAGAALMVSLHADGRATGQGFHVIAAPGRPRSLRLARDLRAALVVAGLPRSSYVTGGLVLRSDLGTLNLSRVPTAMLEAGNMFDATDAARMRTAAGRAPYVAAIVAGIRAYLKR